MRQKTLFKLKDFGSEFGGSRLTGRRKIARPFIHKNPLKIVLKADSARSPHLTAYRSEIHWLFKNFSQMFIVKIYEVAICNGHIHFVGLFSTKEVYTKFIKALTGTIARKFKIKFKLRPWSRILNWGRSFKIALNYVLQNHLESIGVIPYQPRSKDLRASRQLLREVGKRQKRSYAI